MKKISRPLNDQRPPREFRISPVDDWEFRRAPSAVELNLCTSPPPNGSKSAVENRGRRTPDQNKLD